MPTTANGARTTTWHEIRFCVTVEYGHDGWVTGNAAASVSRVTAPAPRVAGKTQITPK